MTEHKGKHTGLATPSPLDHWIDALLHAFAMLMSNVARLFCIERSDQTAECDGGPDQSPETKEVLDQSKATPRRRRFEKSSHGPQPIEGLMVSSMAAQRADMRPSNHEAVLPALSTGHPRACPEDLGSRGEGTREIPTDATTGILGTRPRMNRVWVGGEKPAHPATAAAAAFPVEAGP